MSLIGPLTSHRPLALIAQVFLSSQLVVGAMRWPQVGHPLQEDAALQR
jgi:hypothetical protein